MREESITGKETEQEPKPEPQQKGKRSAKGGYTIPAQMF